MGKFNVNDYWDEFIDEAMENRGQDCEGCAHLEVTPDMYGTGDSPTNYSCGASRPRECHIMDAEFSRILSEIRTEIDGG